MAAVGLLGVVAFLAILVKLWRKGRIWKVATVTIAAVLLYQIFTAVYPPDSFYKGEFESVTGLPFPASGSFLFKDASYPDIHGDYCSAALIKVSEQDYAELRSKMTVRQSRFAPMGSPCRDHLLKAVGHKPVLAESSTDTSTNEFTYWALVDGRPEVIIQYASS
jgi:hypothetical protein